MKLSLALAALLVPAAAAQQSAPTPAAKPAPGEAPAKPAQPEEKLTIEPEAKALLDKSTEKIKGLKDIECKVSQDGPMGMTQDGRGTILLTLAQSAGGLPMQYYKAALTDASGKVTSEYAFDGKTIRKIDHASKTLWTLEVKDEQAMPPTDLWSLFPSWVFEERMENPEIRTTGAKLLGEESIGGVKCRIVEHTREMHLPTEEEEADPKKPAARMVIVQKKFLGEDLLPRKIETSMKVVGSAELGMGDMSTTGTFTEMKANTGPKAESFTLALPDGYKSQAGTADDLGVQMMGEGESELKVKVGDTAPAFSLKDSEGKEVTMDSLKGRVVLLDFWATWCGPCKQAMPSIQKLHEKFAGKSVSVIGVNVWEKKGDAGPKYMADKKFSYACLLAGEPLAEAYGVTGIPTLVLIAADGKVLHTGVGFGQGEEEHLSKLIEAELAKAAK